MIAINDFMELVRQTNALTNKENEEDLCQLVKNYANLEQVMDWLNGLVECNNEEQTLKLASLMELHPLGFEKYVIWNDNFDGPRMRLHYWPENKWPFESIHDHRFNFCSTILCGSYTHETYNVKQGNGNHVELELTGSTLMKKGDVYYFPAGMFHRVLPSDEMTLSLIIRSEAILPYSRVVDPSTKILRNAFGAKNKFIERISNLTQQLSKTKSGLISGGGN
ncbi:hypothetical protein [Paenibacillus beijingensis]|uniref:JmjC domain-containing protein n=1 Tax=Paenibacillus beijingensis TaxID=1126833 RepID=A0A0D5NDL5_9BACL|nr:hypothetical protein [Paenibacillus beijingensis]AJY73321.1 hypothetical protein VN24_00100 [Paenibacillus beijingensis]